MFGTAIGTNENVTMAGADVHNAHLLPCCGVCAMVSDCAFWSLEVVDGSQGWRCKIATSLDNATVIFGPDHVFGLLDEARQNSRMTYWTDKNWKYDFTVDSQLDATQLGSFDACGDFCRKHLARPPWDPAWGGCAYWVYEATALVDNCKLYPNWALQDKHLDTAFDTGYMGIDPQADCNSFVGIEFLGPRLHVEPSYPVTPAMCCYQCKATLGCQEWTWTLDLGEPVYTDLLNPDGSPKPGRRGACVLKARRNTAFPIYLLGTMLSGWYEKVGE
jgi:hypothetical protein